jgi:hypothetical protein
VSSLSDREIAEEAARLRSAALERLNGESDTTQTAVKDSSNKYIAGRLNYFQLPYREKLMSTLRASPMMLLFLLFPSDAHFRGLGRNGALLFVFTVFVIQFGYNYYKWKTTEGQADS